LTAVDVSLDYAALIASYSHHTNFDIHRTTGGTIRTIAHIAVLSVAVTQPNSSTETKSGLLKTPS